MPWPRRSFLADIQIVRRRFCMHIVSLGFARDDEERTFDCKLERERESSSLRVRFESDESSWRVYHARVTTFIKIVIV